MIRLKTKEQIALMKEGGAILSNIVSAVAKKINPGSFSDDLEQEVKEMIKYAGAKPAFLGYMGEGKKPYPCALCLSVNEDIVHCPAGVRREIKDGDVVSIDLGIIYKEFYTDMATTVIAGKADKKTYHLLSVTRDALIAGINVCKVGRPISDIGRAIEPIIKKAEFSIVRDLVGHGVGFNLHEDPMVPNFYDKKMNEIIMEEGLVIAIEPMVAMGKGGIKLSKDFWSYQTSDQSKSAHFEATIAITKDKPLVLTPII